MSHWHQQMADGAEHLISCHWLAFLSDFSHLQLIQNSAPSTICWCQCDIRIWDVLESILNYEKMWKPIETEIQYDHLIPLGICTSYTVLTEKVQLAEKGCDC